VLDEHPFPQVEKFVQEIYWRRYWKSWLELRPAIWDSYLADLKAGFPHEVSLRATAVAAGCGGVSVMDAFSRELVESGYLHNHARMWFASYWIHIEKLPWQLGAAFFYRNLLDADAASNTLSWRWVAGLQTAGKTYRVREQNLRQHLGPNFLETHGSGLSRIGDGEDFVPVEAPEPFPEISFPETGTDCAMLPDRYAVLVHGSDLLLEDSPLASLNPEVLVAVEDWQQGDSTGKVSYRTAALADGVARASAHFGCRTVSAEDATRMGITEAVMLHPFTGASSGDLPFKVQHIWRPEDAGLLRFAKGGFFGFWKQVRKTLHPSSGER
jgi:deoxyribodipyrimidine photo-lyase